MAQDNIKSILVYGNPIDGLSFVGPFADVGDANNYGDIYHRHDDWWVVALQPKEKRSE